jgi:hypothetical protein
MRENAMGFADKRDTVPGRGERVAAYVEAYLKAHPGLSLGELAFRLRADKRDMRRLLNDRSVGHRLEDSLAAYFGADFVDALFPQARGPCAREQELERERTDIAARRERLERDRQAARRRGPDPAAVLRVVPDEAGGRGL